MSNRKTWSQSLGSALRAVWYAFEAAGRKRAAGEMRAAAALYSESRPEVARLLRRASNRPSAA